MEHFTFDAQPELVFSDSEKRTITGVAVPLNATAEKAGKTWTFLSGSVKFGERTPLLSYHDNTRPVGKLVASEWTDRGLSVQFKVSETPSGDEALTLAADGVLGLSIGIDVPEGGYTVNGKELSVSDAFSKEVSLTPVPAFAGAVIDQVSLSKEEPIMADDNTAIDVAALNQTLSTLNSTLTTIADRPTPTVNPTITVNEPAPYRFDGTQAAHCFIRDARDGYMGGNSESKNRIEKFLSETFVSTSNVTALTPTGFRPDLYVDERPIKTPLSALVSGGTIDNLNPFYVPKFGTAGTLVAPHVEGVEPALATFTATSQLVEPEALSGKAELNRELVDKVGPQADAMIWAKMVRAYAVAAEARIATLIQAHAAGPAVLAFNGIDAALADDVDTTLLGVDDLERYGTLAASSTMFSAFATARDADGRKLYPSGAQVNADGTRTGRGTLDLDGLTAVKASALAAGDGWLIEKGAVYQWLQAPRKLSFDIQVKSVYIGLFGYSCEAIIDNAGLRKVTWAA